MFQSNGGEEEVGDRHGWERKMVRGEGRGRREEKKKRRSIRYRAVLRDGGIEPCTIERQEKDKADKGDLRGYTPATGSYHLV
jgi:hypothetical protein